MTVQSAQSAQAAHKQAVRHARKAALLRDHGDTCRCGSAADCFVLARRVPSGPRRTLAYGPSDRGLTSRPELIDRAMVGRVPSCRPCQLRSASRRSRLARRAARPAAVPERRTA